MLNLDFDYTEDLPPVTQDAVVTGATMSITGSRIKAPKPYPCGICLEVFSTKKALSRHVVKHDEPNENNGDDPLNDLKVNYIKVNDDEEKPDPSDLLSADDLTQQEQYAPIKVKLNFSKFKSSQANTTALKIACEECGMLTLKQHMSRHMLTHSGMKPHSCEVCQASFSRKDKLKEHMKKHAEGYESISPKVRREAVRKVVKCRRCDFKTDNKQLMKEHKKTHPAKMLYKWVDLFVF